MFTKLAVVIAALATTTGCFAAVSESDVTGVAESNASAEAALSLDDGPATPLDRPVRAIALPLQRPLHDLVPYLDELKPQAWDFTQGNCVLRYLEIWDPARGARIEIPVTICN